MRVVTSAPTGAHPGASWAALLECGHTGYYTAKPGAEEACVLCMMGKWGTDPVGAAIDCLRAAALDQSAPAVGEPGWLARGLEQAKQDAENFSPERKAQLAAGPLWVDRDAPEE